MVFGKFYPKMKFYILNHKNLENSHIWINWAICAERYLAITQIF